MSDQPTDKYTLPRGAAESARLDLQHKLIIETTGFLVHPRIKAILPEDARVADVGTGTGIWLQAVSETLPSTWKLTGFDISKVQLAADLDNDRREFHVLNILEPVPDEWKAQFDLVHLRLLILALKGNDWWTVAENAFQLLKPGGWVQWQEHNFQYQKVLQSVVGAERTACLEIRRRRAATDPDQQVAKNVEGRPALVEEVGFTNVFEDVFGLDRHPDSRETYTKQTNKANVSILLGALKKDPSLVSTLGTEEELNELLAKADKEAEGGAYVHYTTHIVTAQRPS